MIKFLLVHLDVLACFSPERTLWLWFIYLFFITNLVGVKGTLVFFSLISNDVEQLFYVYLCFFFGEIPVQILCPFFDWVVSLLLSHKSVLYIVDTRLLSDIWFAKQYTIIDHSPWNILLYSDVLPFPPPTFHVVYVLFPNILWIS